MATALADGLWMWHREHPEWDTRANYEPEVASYAVRLTEAVLLVDPLWPEEDAEDFDWLDALARSDRLLVAVLKPDHARDAAGSARAPRGGPPPRGRRPPTAGACSPAPRRPASSTAARRSTSSRPARSSSPASAHSTTPGGAARRRCGCPRTARSPSPTACAATRPAGCACGPTRPGARRPCAR